MEESTRTAEMSLEVYKTYEVKVTEHRRGPETVYDMVLVLPYSDPKRDRNDLFEEIYLLRDAPALPNSEEVRHSISSPYNLPKGIGPHRIVREGPKWCVELLK